MSSPSSFPPLTVVAYGPPGACATVRMFAPKAGKTLRGPKSTSTATVTVCVPTSSQDVAWTDSPLTLASRGAAERSYAFLEFARGDGGATSSLTVLAYTTYRGRTVSVAKAVLAPGAEQRLLVMRGDPTQEGDPSAGLVSTIPDRGDETHDVAARGDVLREHDGGALPDLAIPYAERKFSVSVGSLHGVGATRGPRGAWALVPALESAAPLLKLVAGALTHGTRLGVLVTTLSGIVHEFVARVRALPHQDIVWNIIAQVKEHVVAKVEDVLDADLNGDGVVGHAQSAHAPADPGMLSDTDEDAEEGTEPEAPALGAADPGALIFTPSLRLCTNVATGSSCNDKNGVVSIERVLGGVAQTVKVNMSLCRLRCVDVVADAGSTLTVRVHVDRGYYLSILWVNSTRVVFGTVAAEAAPLNLALSVGGAPAAVAPQGTRLGSADDASVVTLTAVPAGAISDLVATLRAL